MNEIPSDESYPVFRQKILGLVAGQNAFTAEIIQRRLTGGMIHAALPLAIAPGYEEKWDQVSVSLTDVTERRRFEENDPVSGTGSGIRTVWCDLLEGG